MSLNMTPATTRDCRATNQRTAGNDTVPCVLADPDAAEKFNILIYDGLFIWRLNNTWLVWSGWVKRCVGQLNLAAHLPDQAKKNDTLLFQDWMMKHVRAERSERFTPAGRATMRSAQRGQTVSLHHHPMHWGPKTFSLKLKLKKCLLNSGSIFEAPLSTVSTNIHNVIIVSLFKLAGS